MSLAIDSQCLECHLGRALRTARELGDDKTAMTFAKELMALYLSAPEGVSSPWFGPGTAALMQKYYHLDPDRYREEKQQSNAFVMERLPEIRAQVETAPDPVLAALKFAILGNYLDYAALQGQVSFDKLEEMLHKALEMELDGDCYRSLLTDLERANRLLYLTDNAGEIVFDRVLAEQIQKRYPKVEILFCVRGGNVANDATRADAEAVGLPFPVIDNGNTVGGTELSLLSREAKNALDTADVVIAKGMGNTETMYGCGYPVYYAFLVKCGKFQRKFQKPMFTPMLVKDP